MYSGTHASQSSSRGGSIGLVVALVAVVVIVIECKRRSVTIASPWIQQVVVVRPSDNDHVCALEGCRTEQS
jgi:hypothetical protein